jgi:hypothetical protein
LIPRAGIINPFYISIELIGLAVEFQLALHEEGMEFGSFSMVELWVLNLGIAGSHRMMQLLKELL